MQACQQLKLKLTCSQCSWVLSPSHCTHAMYILRSSSQLIAAGLAGTMPLGLSTWMGGHQGGQQLPQPSAPPPSVLNSLSGPGLSLSSPSHNGGASSQESYSIQTQDLTLITKLLGLQTATATAVSPV